MECWPSYNLRVCLVGLWLYQKLLFAVTLKVTLKKSNFGKAAVGWLEDRLVKLPWLLKKFPHLQVGPTCHTQIVSSSSSSTVVAQLLALALDGSQLL